MRSAAEALKVRRLVETNHSDGEIAELTGIPRRTISDWRRGKNQILPRSESAHRCIQEHDYSGLPFAPYAYLLGLYLGDGCLSSAARGVWQIRITLDSVYPEIIKECRSALEAIFPDKNAHLGPRRNSRCVDVSMWSKHWPCLIPQHGRGPKHLRRIALEPWQGQIVQKSHKPFLRGLIHSDGTRIVATERKGNYVRRAPRYAFSNKSQDILSLFCGSCDALGIDWTHPSPWQIAIYRKRSVALLDEFIGQKS